MMYQPKGALTFFFLLIPRYFQVLRKLLFSNVPNVISLGFPFHEEMMVSQKKIQTDLYLLSVELIKNIHEKSLK